MRVSIVLVGMVLASCVSIQPRGADGPETQSAGESRSPTAWELFRNGDYLGFISKALPDRSSQPETLFQRWEIALGHAYQEIGRSAVAVEHFRQAIRENGVLNDYVWCRLGELYESIGASDQAATSYRTGLKDYPASVWRDRMEERLGHLDLESMGPAELEQQLLWLISKRRRKRNSDADLRFMLANLLERNDRGTEAASALRHIVTTYPDAPEAGPALRRFLALQQRFQAIKPLSINEKLRRIQRLSRSGREEQALQEIDLLLTNGVGAPTEEGIVRAQRAKLLLLNRQYDVAYRAYSELNLALIPSLRKEVLFYRARAQARMGDLAGSIEQLLALAGERERSAWSDNALYSAALLTLDQRNYQRATELLAQYLRDYPRSPQQEAASWFLAWSQYRLGQFDDAKASMARLAAKNMSSPVRTRSLYWLARIAEKQEGFAAAAPSYAEVVEQYPLTFAAFSSLSRLAAQDEASISIAVRQLLDGEQTVAVAQLADAELPLDQDSHIVKGAELAALYFYDAAEREYLAAQDSAQSRRDRLLELSYRFFAIEKYHRSQYIPRIFFNESLQRPPVGDDRVYWALAYPQAYYPIVTAAAKRFGLKPAMIWGVMREESAFRPNVVSPAKAVGLMQIIPPTAEEIAQGLQVAYRDGMLEVPSDNITFGSWYLSKLIEKYRGNLYLAVAAYNAGPDAVDRWVVDRGDLPLDEFLEEIPYSETKDYVKRVMKSYLVYETLYGERKPGRWRQLMVEPSGIVAAVDMENSR